MITWQKQGVLFSVGEARAQSPTAILLGKIIRIYYSGRIDGKSHVFYIDVDAETMDIARYKAEPVLSPGEPGSFDENGCVPGCVTGYNDWIRIYYTGFSRGKNGRAYSLGMGKATSRDSGLTFDKRPHATTLEDENFGIATSPFILNVDGVEHYWYSLGSGWRAGNPIYKIKREILTRDGFSNPDCFDGSNFLESTARPAIVKLGDKYCMWFSHRQAEDFRGGKGSYRMGYAESTDLKTWQRDDSKAGIDVGEPGSFDDSMICYPSIVRVKDRLVMFYNGNGFGASGIGWAVCDL